MLAAEGPGAGRATPAARGVLHAWWATGFAVGAGIAVGWFWREGVREHFLFFCSLAIVASNVVAAIRSLRDMQSRRRWWTAWWLVAPLPVVYIEVTPHPAMMFAAAFSWALLLWALARRERARARWSAFVCGVAVIVGAVVAAPWLR